MASYMVVNPRRRRRRAKARRTSASAVRTRRRRSGRSNPGLYMLNARRRRRRSPGYRRNPRAFKLLGIDLGAGALVATGFIGNGILSGLASSMIPVPMLQEGPGRLLVKAGLSIPAAWLSRFVVGPAGMQLVAAGAIAGVLVDAYKMAQAQFPVLPGLGEYNELVEGYVDTPGVQGLAGASDDYNGAVGALPGMERQVYVAPWQQ